MKILIWGFYNQGNLGDDLMAAIFFEMLEEAGHEPVILSRNPRFKVMGYRTVQELQGVEVDLVLLGGGAFFKKGSSPDSEIERSIEDIAQFIEEKALPVFGASIGSDGIDHIEKASPARRRVLQSVYFKGAAVRLKADLEIGLPNLVNLPDVVLCTSQACARYQRLNIVEPPMDAPETLINLSRRSVLQLPRAILLARGGHAAFFRAHTGKHITGGEIVIPWTKVICDDDMRRSLGYIRAAKTMISSKLHPGVMALSFGKRFISVSPRPKTKEFFIESHIREGENFLYLDQFSHWLSEKLQEILV